MTDKEIFYQNKSEELVNLCPHVGVKIFVEADGSIEKEEPIFGLLAEAVAQPEHMVEFERGRVFAIYSEPRIKMEKIVGLQIDDFHEKRQDPAWWGALKVAIMSEFLWERQKNTGDKVAPA